MSRSDHFFLLDVLAPPLVCRCGTGILPVFHGRDARATKGFARALSVLVFSAVTFAAGEAAAAKKYIFSGWDLGDATPAEILKYANEFDKTACDGVAISLAGAFPGADSFRRRHIAEEPRWTDAELDAFVPTFMEITKHPSLSHSFVSVSAHPRKARFAWNDDAAWGLFRDNLAAIARFAKKTRLEGILTDFEDYWRKKQFELQPEDGDYRATALLARQRGRELFGAVFAAFPEAVILSYQLLTTDTAYARSDDPAGLMLDKQDLWPAFANGILDAMPPTAKLVDGNESFGYMAKASNQDFYRSVRDQLVAVLPLVAQENRAKYRAQVSVSFGLYMDSYSVGTNSAYYFGPVRGKRIHHFEDNLRQATECADEYVWFWGEKGFWIDWPADLKEQSGNTWRSSGNGTWRGKYYEGGWGLIKPWSKTLDGDFDLMARGVKEPIRCVREQLALQKAEGRFENLVKAPPKPDDSGHVHQRITNLETDGWYGVRVLGRGKIVRGNVYFQWHGRWRWNLGNFRLQFAQADIEGWREGHALVRIPDGATDIFLILDGKREDKTSTTEFKELEIFRIR